MSKIREIIRLREVAGISDRKISRALDVSRPVVAQYLSQARAAGLCWEEIKELSDDELLHRMRRGKAPEIDPRLAQLVAELPEIVKQLGRRGVTRHLLWEEYRDKHDDGYSYSQFCFHLQLHTEASEVSMHLEHKPGEKLFVDYAGWRPVLVDPVTGTQTHAELFVAVFPASGLIYIEAVTGQDLDSFILGTRHTFEFVDGVPLIVVPDNLKAAVTVADRYDPLINETYEDFARHYGCAVLPARVCKPKDKALVEAAVDLVYKQVYARLRDRQFATLDDLNTALWEKLDLLNDREMQRLKLSRRQRFDECERKELRVLPVDAYELREFDHPRVQLNYHIYLRTDRHYYSVPYGYRRKIVKVAYSSRTVEIYHNNERIAVHRRDRRPNGYTTTLHHMPSQHRAMVEWTPQRFLRWAAKIGPHTVVVVRATLDDAQVPEQAFRRCLGLLSLERRYDAARLEAACHRADVFGTRSYRSVKSVLEKGLDRQPLIGDSDYQLPSHENIRGSRYFENVGEVE